MVREGETVAPSSLRSSLTSSMVGRELKTFSTSPVSSNSFSESMLEREEKRTVLTSFSINLLEGSKGSLGSLEYD